MTRSNKLRVLLDGLAREYRNAPVEEWNYPHRDQFRRLHTTVGVELCHGGWHTFTRHGGDPCVTKHPCRETAKRHALTVLGVAP